MKNIEEIREIFKNDRFATENGAVIDEVGEDFSVCSLEISPRHQNAVGAVMGGVPFMLADFAFAVAVNHETMNTVSLSSTISFLGVAKGNRLIAKAECVKFGRATCYYTVHITDEIGTRVAEVVFTGFNKN